MNTIVLTNSNAGTNQKHKLSLRLTTPMRLENCVVCVTGISLYYSWPNIKSEYKNNSFKYKRTADNKEFDVILYDGSYPIKQINNYLHKVMKKNGDKEDDQGKFPIELYANNVYQRVTAVIKPNYILQIPIDGFGQVMGFTKGTQLEDKYVSFGLGNELYGDEIPQLEDKYVSIGPDDEQNGEDIPEIERVISVSLHCNLVNNIYVLENSLIYSFTPNVKFGYLINERPNLAQWRNARNNADIYEIEVWFTDQDNNPLDIQDPKIRVELQIKDVKL